MSVHSLRLPDTLWQRLNSALAIVNAERRRPVALSTFLRALLERGLDDPAGLPNFDRKVVRPNRILEKSRPKTADAKTSKPTSSESAKQTDECSALHIQLKHFMYTESYTPSKVFREAVLQSDNDTRSMADLRLPTMQFIHSGFFPEGSDVKTIFAKLQHWLRGKT